MSAPVVSFDSKYYPYRKVQSGYNEMQGAEEIPYKVLWYLMDMPDADGYEPIDDNSRPRVRLMKYLIYDGEQPLSEALPSPQDKLSILFDPQNPDANTDLDHVQHPYGYRLYAQNNFGQSQLDAQTIIKCYIDRVVANSDFTQTLALAFEIWTNVNYESNTATKAYNRAYDIEQCIIEALHGIDMTGVGTIQFNQRVHGDCGSRAIYDEYTNTGRKLTMCVVWNETTNNIDADSNAI